MLMVKLVRVAMMKNYLPSILRWNMSLNISNILKEGLWRSVKLVQRRNKYFSDSIRWKQFQNSSVISQKGKFQIGCYKKTKHVEFSEKRIFLPHPWYAHDIHS